MILKGSFNNKLKWTHFNESLIINHILNEEYETYIELNRKGKERK